MKKNKLLLSLLIASFCLAAAGCGEEGNKPSNDINVWTATGTEKLMRDLDYSVRYQNTALEISAFKNEYESAQIIISSSLNKGEYSVELSALKKADGTELPTDAFTVYHEKYINVTEIKDHNAPTSVGYYPDALLPMEKAVEYGENILTGKNQGIWVTVKPSATQSAGKYTGNFTVKVDGKSFNVPVSVTVYDYALSDVVHSKTSFAIDNEMLGWGEKDATVEMQQAYYDFLLDYRVSAQQLPGSDLSFVDMEGESLERFLEYAAKYTKDPRCSSFNIPFHITTATMTKNGTKKSVASVDFEKFKNTLRAMVEYSVTNKVNLFEKAGTYFIFYDEYDINGAVDEANYNSDMAVEVCEGLAEELRETVYCDDAEFLEEVLHDLARIQHKLVGSITDEFEAEKACFVPTINRYHTEAGRALYTNFAEASYGDEAELWAYTCMNPRAPHPTYHIEDILLSSRLLSWIMYDYDIVGNLYWMVNLYAWRENAWDDLGLQDYYEKALRYPDANGDGFLVYPGNDYGIYGPVGSVRLHSIRDGNEDYDLMYALEEMYVKKGVTEEAFDAVMDHLNRNLYTGTMVRNRDSLLSDFAQSRETLADLLEMASNTGTVIKNMTMENGVTKVTLVADKETTLYNGDTQLTPTSAGELNEYTVSVSMTERVNYLNITAKNGDKSYGLKLNIGGRNVTVKGSTLLSGAEMVTAGTVTYDVQDGIDVLRISYGADERLIAQADVTSLGVDDSVNTVVLNIYSYSDNAIDLKILSKCERSQSFVESSAATLKRGWNRIEILAVDFNCASNGALTMLRFNLDQTNAAEIALGNIEIS